MIELNNITVAYGKNIVYRNFSHTFDSGVNVVLGKSGCGKTTLLNVISGLVPFSGERRVDGKIAVVFQQPSLAPVSVWNNVNLVVPRGDNVEKIERALRMARIFEKKDRNALSLSGGEQQRVSLARAFATDAQILLLDEPFSNLDYGVRTELCKTLDDMLCVAPKTVVYVTHDIDDALATADRIFLAAGSPCTLALVAEISTPRCSRDEFSPDAAALKQKLRQLLVHD